MVERTSRQHHLILFDGGCGFCSRAVALVSPLDVRGRFSFAPQQGEEGSKLLAEHGIRRGDPDTLLVFPSPPADTAKPLSKSAAVLFIVKRLQWPWRALALLGWLPSRLLDWGYDHVARCRLMLSGPSVSCSLPPVAPGDRSPP